MIRPLHFDAEERGRVVPALFSLLKAVAISRRVSVNQVIGPTLQPSTVHGRQAFDSFIIITKINKRG